MVSLVIILDLIFPASTFCATVTLKSGKKVEGRILEKTDQYIKIECDGSIIYYEHKYIAGIQGDNPADTATPQEGPSLKDANTYLKEGLEYGSEARFKEAEEAFRKGLETNSSEHNLQEALKIIDDLKNGTIGEEYAVYLFKGSSYLMNAQYQQAIAEFREAGKLKPDEPDLYYYLGVCNYQLGEYQEAVSYLKKALEIKADDEFYYYLGVSCYSLGQYQEAIANLRRALEINPNDADAYSVIGISNYLLGDIQQAREDLHKAQDLFKKQGDYLKSKDIEDFLGQLNG